MQYDMYAIRRVNFVGILTYQGVAVVVIIDVVVGIAVVVFSDLI